MNRERIKHLMTVMRRVARDSKKYPNKVQFDIANWGHESKGRGCHTVACAAGWAALDKQFQAEGLLPSRWPYPTLAPEFDGRKGDGAMANFLGISDNAAWFLFIGGGSYPNEAVAPKHVIRKLKRLLTIGDKRFVAAERLAGRK